MEAKDQLSRCAVSLEVEGVGVGESAVPANRGLSRRRRGRCKGEGLEEQAERGWRDGRGKEGKEE